MTVRLIRLFSPDLIPLLLVFSVGAVDVATDIYLPTMPLLTRYFATSEEMGALTISCYLLAFCLSGPIYGPLSDALGRRRVLLFGMGVFTVFSGLCACAWSIHSLIAFRFFQGLGGGVAWILGLAIVRDVYAQEESVHVMAKISLVIALSPAAAPIFGGYMGVLWGWRSNFYIVAIWSFLIFFLLLYVFPETLPRERRQKLAFKSISRNYAILLSSLPFMAYSLISAAMFSALFSYISITPFFFIKDLGISVEIYGYHQMVLLIFYMVGTFLNKRFAPFVGVDRFLGLGLALSLVGGVCLVLGTVFAGGNPHLMTGMMGVCCLGIGIIFSSTAMQAMEVFPHMGGAAAALLSVTEMLFAAMAVFVAGGLYVNSMLPVSVCILVLTLVAGSLYLTVLHHKAKTSATH